MKISYAITVCNEFVEIQKLISKKKDRLKRLKKSKNISKKIFDQILKSQTSDVERKKRSDIVLYNNSIKKIYLYKINKLLDRLVK